MSDINRKDNNTQNLKGTVSNTKNLSGSTSVNMGLIPNIQVGTTTSLEAGEDTYVELDDNSTRLNPIFNFGIPKGKNGQDGYTPVKGIDYFTEEDIGSLHLVDKQYVDDAIANAQFGGDVDLSNYYTKEEVDNKIPNLDDYALKSEIPDVSIYQTEEDVNALISEAIGGIENGSY